MFTSRGSVLYIDLIWTCQPQIRPLYLYCGPGSHGESPTRMLPELSKTQRSSTDHHSLAELMRLAEAQRQRGLSDIPSLARAHAEL